MRIGSASMRIGIDRRSLAPAGYCARRGWAVTIDSRRTSGDTQAVAGSPAVEDLAGALTELSGLLLGGETLEQTLQRVVRLAVRTVPGCDAAGVTLLTAGRPSTAAASDERVLPVDQAQYDAGEGPCLDAARHLRTNRVDLDEADERWPAFTARARAEGIHSFLAAPLVAAGEGLGALNLYSRSPDGFGELDEALVEMFTGQASVALANAQRYAAAVALGTQLHEAMATRSVIEQAKGALMSARGLTEVQAFDALRERSQRANRKLHDVATEVLQATRERSGTIAAG